MALTATYDAALSRIKLAGGSLGVSATYAVFDRTLNGITYTTVRGGTHVTVASAAASVDDYEFPVGVAITYRVRSYDASNVLQATFTVAITQAQPDPWLKSVQRPFLNQQIEAADASDVTHLNRSQVFKIVGRSTGVAVTDIGAGLTYDLMVATLTSGDAANLRYLATSGDILFLQVPDDFPVPGGYYTVSDVRETRQNMPWELRWFTLPLARVAQPGPEVIGTTYTIASMLAEYATVTAVIAGNATIADLLQRVASPSEVLVP
jgi:hypothetical protein